MESTLTIKGQMTLPKAIRDHLHLKPGDRVKFFVHRDGTAVILPKLPASALRGIIKTTKHVTIDEMHDAVTAGATDGHRRGKNR